MIKKTQAISSFFKTKTKIDNHWYYLGLFLSILGVHLLHLWVVRETFSFSFLFYSISAFLQTLIEISFLILLGKVVRKISEKKLFLCFVVFTFLLMMIHLVDFPMTRIMDMSIWFIFRFLSHETVENFIEMLYATNVALLTWFLYLGAAALVIIGSIWLFKFLEKRSHKRPWHISHGRFTCFLLITPCLLFAWNGAFSQHILDKEHVRLQKGLPWKAIFKRHQNKEIQLDFGFAKEEIALKAKNLPLPLLENKPDIFLFIVESLREDFIDPKAAPHLTAFRKEALDFKKTIAAANATQLSWYSLFFSKPALFWGLQKEEGSPYLRWLKEAGYEIHVLSSARLGYYQMDKKLFGEKMELIDSLECFRGNEEISAYEADKATIERLCEKIHDPERSSGRVFITFLDATHFGYSFPEMESYPFTPFPERLNYLEIALSKKGLEGVINRYRNAIYAMDALFGNFYASLKKSPSFNDSIVVFTGDHGEQFYENDYIFHSSYLSKEQTAVPLFIKLGNEENGAYQKNMASLSSHQDIMPTLFHYLMKERFVPSAFYGTSLTSLERPEYFITSRYNASMNPDEFAVESEGFKAILRKKDYNDISCCKRYQIVAVTDENDRDITLSDQGVKEKILESYRCLFLKNDPK